MPFNFLLTSGESCDNLQDMKERVVFIGAGKVAWHLSYAMHNNGYVISGIASRRKSSAQKLAGTFNTEWTTSPEKIVMDADIIFITTQDREIKGVVKNLCIRKVINRSQLVVHTSGLLTAKVLRCVEKFGALPLSIHPCLSFADRSYKADEMKGIFFAVEGGKEAVKKGKTIVRKIGGKPFTIASVKKPLYHLALVFASNLFVGIEDMAVELLQKCGIKKRDALKLIQPLVVATEKNIFEKGTLDALTGPIERGDVDTIKKHLALLKKQKRSFDNIYKELSEYLLTMVKKRGKLQKT